MSPAAGRAPEFDSSARVETAHGAETAFFFGRPGHRKFAVLHEPTADATTHDGIVLVHAHFEEKLRAHRVLVEAAREWARRGHPVLRFDYSGHGDSEGECGDFGFADLEADTDEAAALLRAHTGRMPVLAGLRFGAVLAARAAARLEARAALWAPVIDFRAWMDEVLRVNLSFQLTHHGKVTRGRGELTRELESGGSVNIEGYLMSSRFYVEAAASGWLDEPGFPGGAAGILAVAIENRPTPSQPDLEPVVTRWAATVPAVFARVAEEAFWGNTQRHRTRAPELVETTSAWIEGRPVTAAAPARPEASAKPGARR